MAADILIYDSQVVPVGKDQKQHVEVTRDVAIKFNQTYGDTFVVPEPRIREETAVVPGIDGQKMSKSYENTIELFGAEKPLRKKIMSLVMDSRGMDEPKPDADRNIAFNCSNWSGRRKSPLHARNACEPVAMVMVTSRRPSLRPTGLTSSPCDRSARSWQPTWITFTKCLLKELKRHARWPLSSISVPSVPVAWIRSVPNAYASSKARFHVPEA